MTENNLVIGNIKLPINAATKTFAILAKRGAGKTYTACVLTHEFYEFEKQKILEEQHTRLSRCELYGTGKVIDYICRYYPQSVWNITEDICSYAQERMDLDFKGCYN